VVPWEGLHGQMGAEYTELRDFKKKVIATLRKVQLAYPALRLETTSEGGPLRKRTIGHVRLNPKSL
jgi:hypothetical protein